MQAEPFSGVTVPLDVEAVAADPVEAGEGSVELFAEILREARAVALNEAILGTVPLSQEIDRIVEQRRPDGGQEAGLQEVVDQVLAAGRHRRFSCRRKTGRPHVSSWLTLFRHGSASAFASSGQKLVQPMDSVIGEIVAAFLPALALAAMSASSKNCRRAWAQQCAGVIGPCARDGSYS